MFHMALPIARYFTMFGMLCCLEITPTFSVEPSLGFFHALEDKDYFT